MNNEERDKAITETLKKTTETHTVVMVMAEKVSCHDSALFGNGQPGAVKDIVILKERQDQCPARLANTVGGKRLGLAYIMLVIAIISIITSIAISLHSN